MDESGKAQLLLERSLRDRQQQLHQKTQEWQGKEQALFTKVNRLRCLPCCALLSVALIPRPAENALGRHSSQS
jgi:hypothetical protein